MKKNILLSGIVALAFGVFTVACDDDDNYVINTDSIITSVTTGDAETTATTATVTGTVADLSSMTSGNYTVGAVYSTTENPVAAGTKAPGALQEDGTTVVTTITGLQDGVTYYYATYVTLQGKVTEYGDVKSFVTTSSAVGTAEASAVTASTATLGGTVNGVSDMLQAGTLVHGFKYAADASMVENGIDLPVETSTNSYTAVVDRLVPNTTYYYAAYMMLNGAPVYGDVKSFTTTRGNLDAADADADFVDMGVKLQWAKYNVGAEKESQLGGLYGFGDVTGLNRSASTADYSTSSISGSDNDVAAKAGIGFLPTQADFEALLAATTQEVAEVDGVKGLKLTSTVNGNTLFFPAAGSRTGEEVTAEGLMGLYMTGDVVDNNNNYAVAYSFDGSELKSRMAPVYTGMSVRAVRKKVIVGNNEQEIDNSKLSAAPDGSNFRITISSEWSGGVNAVDLGAIVPEKRIVARFSLSGVTFKEGAAGSYLARMGFAGNGWGISYWDNVVNRGTAIVNGDGIYTVAFDVPAPVESCIIAAIDIVGMADDLESLEDVSAELLSVQIDPANEPVQYLPTDLPYKVGDLEDNGNIRVELSASWGNNNYASASYGPGTLGTNLTITGIDGNLKADAPASFVARIGFASSGWWPSIWDPCAGAASVTGDGTYEIQAPIQPSGTGFECFTVDILGLSSALVDPSLLNVTVNDVYVPLVIE